MLKKTLPTLLLLSLLTVAPNEGRALSRGLRSIVSRSCRPFRRPDAGDFIATRIPSASDVTILYVRRGLDTQIAIVSGRHCRVIDATTPTATVSGKFWPTLSANVTVSAIPMGDGALILWRDSKGRPLYATVRYNRCTKVRLRAISLFFSQQTLALTCIEGSASHWKHREYYDHVFSNTLGSVRVQHLLSAKLGYTVPIDGNKRRDGQICRPSPAGHLVVKSSGLLPEVLVISDTAENANERNRSGYRTLLRWSPSKQRFTTLKRLQTDLKPRWSCSPA